MLKKTFFYSVIACAVVTLISSCNNHTDKEEVAVNRVFADYHYALDSVIKSKEGIIGGIELGQSVKLIPAKEVNQAVEKANDHITFEQTIDSVSKYTITYSFENDTITEMEVLITSSNGDEGDKILADLKSYYTKKYTAPIMDKGYFVFNCFDSKKQNFTITITDNSGASNSVIDMFVYREK
ncbi:MAG: hypothetical protein ACHQII_01705 [Bacteroidia bacterium]